MLGKLSARICVHREQGERARITREPVTAVSMYRGTYAGMQRS